MVQPADVRDGANLAERRRLDLARQGGVAVERQMRAAVVVVVEIRDQDALQMVFAQHDDVIEALATDRADEPLDVGILPRRARGANHFFDAEAGDSFPECVAINTVAITHLRATRRAAGVTQVELASRIGQTQSFVSKCERGETRLDIVQLRAICHALLTTLVEFVQRYEKRLRSGSRSTESQKGRAIE